MPTPWEVDTAEYAEKSKLVSAQDTFPYGVIFSSDGSKMYILGYSHNTVYQYTLSTPWDVSTAEYSEKSKYVGAQDTFPYGVIFSFDGSKMYILGDENDTVYQYALSTPWDVSTAEYAEKFKLVSAQDTFPYGVIFSFDGSKMYILGYSHNTVYQYTLSTPWDVSTAEYSEKSKYVGAQDTFPYGVIFSFDGSKMYILGDENDTVYQYALSTPWDVSTAEYSEKSKDVSAQDTAPRDLTFSSDGSKMYIIGYNTTTVYQYTLPAPPPPPKKEASRTGIYSFKTLS